MSMFKFKLGDDDPYVGIEWEPQLSVPDFGPKPVRVSASSMCKKPEISDNKDNTILLSLPLFMLDKQLNVDMAVCNLEVRTALCRYSQLNDAIIKAQERLERFVTDLAKETCPIGVLLPSSKSQEYPCFKHFNIGVVLNNPDEVDEVKAHIICVYNGLHDPPGKIILKPDNIAGDRLHIKIPYDFDDYNMIISLCKEGDVLRNLDKLGNTLYRTFDKMLDQPLLVGYSYGKTFIRKNNLK